MFASGLAVIASSFYILAILVSFKYPGIAPFGWGHEIEMATAKQLHTIWEMVATFSLTFIASLTLILFGGILFHLGAQRLWPDRRSCRSGIFHIRYFDRLNLLAKASVKGLFGVIELAKATIGSLILTQCAIVTHGVPPNWLSWFAGGYFPEEVCKEANTSVAFFVLSMLICGIAFCVSIALFFGSFRDMRTAMKRR
jgi:hypothetical protein